MRGIGVIANVVTILVGTAIAIRVGFHQRQDVGDVAIWAGLLWSVVLSAFVGWIVWGWVNAVRGVARTAPLMYLMPPVAGAVAWLSTGEHYNWVKLLGAGQEKAG